MTMKKRIKLLKQWGEHAVGTELEVDADTFAELIEGKIAEEIKAAATTEPDDAELAKKIGEAVGKAVDDKLNAANLARKAVTIEVRDLEDNDPFLGYAEKNLSLKDASEQAIYHYAGMFLRDIAKARADGAPPKRLRKAMELSTAIRQKAAGDGMVVGSDEYGGYLLMPAAMALIDRATIEASVVRPRARRFTLGTQMLKVPLMRDENRTSGQIYQGIRCYWEGELDDTTASRPKMREMTFVLHKIMALGYVSGEFEKWSPASLGSWLIPKFGAAIGYTEDIAFINGKGGGQPLGILNASCGISVTAETGQDADTFVLANSTKMRARLLALAGGAPVWLMNQMLWTQLPLLNLEVGTGGAPVFINSATGNIPQTLWGVPILFTEKVPALGDAKDVVLCDMNDYVVADDQAGPQIATSIHVSFLYDQNCFRLLKWVDGQNLSDTAFTPYIAGSTTPDTISPVVTLGARA